MVSGKGVAVPAPPFLNSPPNAATNQAQTVLFRWGPLQGDVVWHFEAAHDSLFTMLVVEDSLLADTSYTVSGLGYGETYFWRVRGRNEQGYGGWSEVWQFTVTLYTVAVNYDIRWNMVSVPLSMSDLRTTEVFSSAVSGAYTFDNGYEQKDTLENGRGYWLKFSEETPVLFNGLPIESDTIPLNVGWNMIGSVTSAIPVSALVTIPSDILASNFFTYSNGYVSSDTLSPGKGYWIKANQAGALILFSSKTKIPISIKE